MLLKFTYPILSLSLSISTGIYQLILEDLGNCFLSSDFFFLWEEECITLDKKFYCNPKIFLLYYTSYLLKLQMYILYTIFCSFYTTTLCMVALYTGFLQKTVSCMLYPNIAHWGKCKRWVALLSNSYPLSSWTTMVLSVLNSRDELCLTRYTNVLHDLL